MANFLKLLGGESLSKIADAGKETAKAHIDRQKELDQLEYDKEMYSRRIRRPFIAAVIVLALIGIIVLWIVNTMPLAKILGSAALIFVVYKFVQLL